MRSQHTTIQKTLAVLACSLALLCYPAWGQVAALGDVVNEAVDLSAAHELGGDDEAKSMESLLHWAIGRFLRFAWLYVGYLIALQARECDGLQHMR